MLFRPLAFLAALSLTTVPAGAQDVGNGQKFGAWTVGCEALGMNRTACVLNQTLSRDSDQAFIAQMMAFWSADGEKMYLAARVPMGAYLPSGFAIRAEEKEEAVPFVWQACQGQVCEAMREVDSEMLDDLGLDNEAVLGSFRPRLGMEPIVFRFSMAGIREGLTALHPAE
ncbi:invasion associated locus B family protein [Sagittula sp. S175]|uniref:invasion associated locus B family protein n=1 Tax=Sagittula sp. S175 TaxID=3415129 RepID=UPI003C7AE247